MTTKATTVEQLNSIMFGAVVASIFLTVTIIAMGALKNRLADEHDNLAAAMLRADAQRGSAADAN